MKILNKLVPKFLRQFDQYLLLHHPVIWETRGHYFLFYSFVVVNSIVLGLGLLYPVSLGQPLDFTFVKQMIIVGNFLGLIAWAFFVYVQTFRRKNAYNWQENLVQLGVYALCLASLGINILLFPNVVRMRATSLLSKEATLNAIHQYSQAKYLDDLAKKYTVSLKPHSNHTYYLKRIQEMSMNQDKQVEEYLKLQEKLMELLDISKSPNYQQHKARIDKFAAAYVAAHSSLILDDFEFEYVYREGASEELVYADSEEYSERVPYEYQDYQAFNEELAFWREDSTYFAQQIYANSKWNEVFKQEVIRNNLHPARLLNLYLRKRGTAAHLVYMNSFFLQGKTMKDLFKKMQLDPYQDRKAHETLTSLLSDLYNFHDSNVFFSSWEHLILDMGILDKIELDYKYNQGSGSTQYMNAILAWTNTPRVKAHFQQWSRPGAELGLLLRSLSVVFVFFTLLAMVFRIFTIRNLFISAVICVIGAWAVLFGIYILDMEGIDLLFSSSYYGYGYIIRDVLLLYYPLGLLLLLQGISITYFFSVQHSQKWMRTWIATLLSASCLAGAFSFSVLMRQNVGDYPNKFGERIMFEPYFMSLYIGVLLVSVLGFVLYQAYQRLNYLPKMR